MRTHVRFASIHELFSVYIITKTKLCSKQGRDTQSHIGLQHPPPHHQHMQHHPGMKPVTRESRMRSASEANLLQSGTSAVSVTTMTSRAMTNRRHSIAPIDPGLVYDRHPAHMIHPQILQQQQLQQQFQQQQMQMQQTPQHPHLQLRGVEAAGRAVKVAIFFKSKFRSPAKLSLSRCIFVVIYRG